MFDLFIGSLRFFNTPNNKTRSLNFLTPTAQTIAFDGANFYVPGLPRYLTVTYGNSPAYPCTVNTVLSTLSTIVCTTTVSAQGTNLAFNVTVFGQMVSSVGAFTVSYPTDSMLSLGGIV